MNYIKKIEIRKKSKRGKPWVYVIFDDGSQNSTSIRRVLVMFNKLFCRGKVGYLNKLIEIAFRNEIIIKDIKDFKNYKIIFEVKKEIDKLKKKYKKLYLYGTNKTIKISLKELIKIAIGIGYCEDIKYPPPKKGRHDLEEAILKTLLKDRKPEELTSIEKEFDPNLKYTGKKYLISKEDKDNKNIDEDYYEEI